MTIGSTLGPSTLKLDDRHFVSGFDAWPKAFNRAIPTRRLTWDEAFEEELSSSLSITVLRPLATIIDG
jgi:hypothetical protein